MVGVVAQVRGDQMVINKAEVDWRSRRQPYRAAESTVVHRNRCSRGGYRLAACKFGVSSRTVP